MKALFPFLAVICFAAVVVAAEPTALTPRPTLWLIGDSTVRNGTRGLQGWGDPLKELFDPAKLRVENRARGGRGSRTFFTEGLWEKVRAELKPGDFVLMQFGHNDGGSLTQNRGRASLKGVDDRTEETTLTNGTKEVVHTFGWYLRKYVTDTRAKGATPIVCSPIPRNDWKDGRVLRGTNSYAFFAAEVARQEGVGFVDLHEIIAHKYEAEGQEAVTKKYFFNEHTHTTPAGAALNAACVVEGLRTLKECDLAKRLNPDSELAGETALVAQASEPAVSQVSNLPDAGLFHAPENVGALPAGKPAIQQVRKPVRSRRCSLRRSWRTLSTALGRIHVIKINSCRTRGSAVKSLG